MSVSAGVTSAEIVTLDFETDDNGVALVNGRMVVTPPLFGTIVGISTTGPNLGAAIFDSSPGGPNSGGTDEDMIVDIGNVLILQNQNVPLLAGPDVFLFPVVSNEAGTIVFDLTVGDRSVSPQSIDIIDRDATGVQLVTLIDSQDRERVYFIPERFTGDIIAGQPGVATIDLVTTAPQVSPNDSSVVTQINTDPGFDRGDLARMIVRLAGSGAIDNVVVDVFDCQGDDECDDGVFCNGMEACVDGACGPGDEPCDSAFPICLEDEDRCVQCESTGDCNTLIDCDAPSSPRCNDGICECDAGTPLCLDVANATLFNDAGEACFGDDRIVEIDIRVGFSLVPICGAQVAIEFDTDNLELIEVIKGADVPGNTAGAAFNTILFAFVDPVAGTLDYAIGDDPTGGCSNATSETSVIARLRFRVIGGCDSFGSCFRVAAPGTRLGGSDGTEVRATACDDPTMGVVGTCSEPLNLTIDPPTLSCPFDGRQTFSAACGTAMAHVDFDSPTVSDDCDVALDVACTVDWFPQCSVDGDCGPGGSCGQDTPGICDNPANASNICNDPDLALGGGGFCSGVTAIACSAMDSCEQVDECRFEIENTGMNELEVRVQMSPVMDPGNAFEPLNRCVELELRKCGVTGFCSGTGAVCDPDNAEACDGQPDDCIVPSFATDADVLLGRPNELPGRGTIVTQVPADNWDCIRVRDPWHTLQSVCEVVCDDDGVLKVDLQQAPGLGTSCHWLINGNLNGDDTIDVLDFVLLVAPNMLPDDFDKSIVCGQMEPPQPGGIGDTHPDINGDGRVDGLDFSFVSINFFETDETNCNSVCGAPGASSGPAQGVRDISVNALINMGLTAQRAHAADLNDDGKVDMTDMAIYANTHTP